MSEKKTASMWDRTEYDIISETDNDEATVIVLRLRDRGAKVICHLPKHTQQSEQRIAGDLAFALMNVYNSHENMLAAERIEIIKERG